MASLILSFLLMVAITVISYLHWSHKWKCYTLQEIISAQNETIGILAKVVTTREVR